MTVIKNSTKLLSQLKEINMDEMLRREQKLIQLMTVLATVILIGWIGFGVMAAKAGLI